jgi:uncharacterized MAPEG superfamily protein
VTGRAVAVVVAVALLAGLVAASTAGGQDVEGGPRVHIERDRAGAGARARGAARRLARPPRPLPGLHHAELVARA